MISRITVAEVRDRLAAGERLRFLDVREPEEHAFCRIEGCQLIPLGELAGRVHEINDDEFLIVYCHHGVRSLSAVGILQQAGLENTASLSGGIDAWSVQADPNVPRY